MEAISARKGLQKEKMKLIQAKLEEAQRDNFVLQEMLRKLRIQTDIERKVKNQLAEQFSEIDKIVYSLGNIKYLDSGRKIAVDGLAYAQNFMFGNEKYKQI